MAVKGNASDRHWQRELERLANEPGGLDSPEAKAFLAQHEHAMHEEHLVPVLEEQRRRYERLGRQAPLQGLLLAAVLFIGAVVAWLLMGRQFGWW